MAGGFVTVQDRERKRIENDVPIRLREKSAREAWKVEPVQTIRAGGPYRCPDDRCGEDVVLAVPHPDDPEQIPNRCPTCLTTVAPVSPGKPSA
jgi:hypothetical protein